MPPEREVASDFRRVVLGRLPLFVNVGGGGKADRTVLLALLGLSAKGLTNSVSWLSGRSVTRGRGDIEWSVCREGWPKESRS